MGFLLFDIAEYLLSLQSAKDFESVRNPVELAPVPYRQGYDSETRTKGRAANRRPLIVRTMTCMSDILIHRSGLVGRLEAVNTANVIGNSLNQVILCSGRFRLCGLTMTVG